ncbi:MAG: hypothetical protein BGO77_02770 [Caedibacter sp. 37-49]|nr:MAG: hypothetical protein BGO77_02770 [Caedibacter sp. 37-49]
MKKVFQVYSSILLASLVSFPSFASTTLKDNCNDDSTVPFKQNILYRIKNDENQSFLTFNTHGIAEFVRDPQYSGKQITFNQFNLFYIVPTESGTTFNIMQNRDYLRYNGEKVTKESGSLFKINLRKHYVYDNKKHYYISANSGNGTKVINCIHAFDRTGDKNHITLKKSDHTWERHRTFLIEEYLPAHPEDQFNIGKLYLETKNYPHAINFLQKLYMSNEKNMKEKVTHLLIKSDDYVKYHILGKKIYSDNTNITLPIPRLLSSSTTLKKGNQLIVNDSNIDMVIEYCNLKNTPTDMMRDFLRKDPFLNTVIKIAQGECFIEYRNGMIRIDQKSNYKPSAIMELMAHHTEETISQVKDLTSTNHAININFSLGSEKKK